MLNVLRPKPKENEDEDDDSPEEDVIKRRIAISIAFEISIRSEQIDDLEKDLERIVNKYNGLD